MGTVGTIKIRMVTDTQKFTKGLKNAGKDLAGFVGGFASLDTIQGKLSALGGALTLGGITAGLTALTKSGLDRIDNLAESAGRIGTTTEALSQLSYAAKITGSDTEGLEASLTKMNKNLAESSGKAGPATDALRTLGLDAAALTKMDPAEAFLAISGGISSIENPALKTTLAMDLFGKSGASLLNTLNAGPEAIRKLQEEAVKLGVSVGQVDAVKVGAAKDALDKVGFAIEGIGNKLAVGLAPYIEVAANKFVELGLAAGDSGVTMNGALEMVAVGVGMVADVVHTAKLGFQLFGAIGTAGAALVVKGIDALAKGLEWLINKLPGVKVSFGNFHETLGNDLEQLTDERFKGFMDELAKPPPSEGIKSFFKGITDAANASAAASLEAGKKLAAIDPAAAQLANDISTLKKSFGEEVDMFGVSGKQADVMKLAIKGATAEQLKDVQALADKLDGLKVQDDVKTATEKMAEEKGKLQKLFDAGSISSETFKRATLKTEKDAGLDGGYKATAALQLGSKDARSALLTHYGRDTSSEEPVKSTAKSAAKSVELEHQMVGFLNTIASSVAGRAVNLFAIP